MNKKIEDKELGERLEKWYAWFISIYVLSGFTGIGTYLVSNRPVRDLQIGERYVMYLSYYVFILSYICSMIVGWYLRKISLSDGKRRGFDVSVLITNIFLLPITLLIAFSLKTSYTVAFWIPTILLMVTTLYLAVIVPKQKVVLKDVIQMRKE